MKVAALLFIQFCTHMLCDGLENSALRSRPYHISIHAGRRHVCSGAIIKERYVLTAAGCCSLISQSPAAATVLAGTVDLRRLGDNGQIREISRCTAHPIYKGRPATSRFRFPSEYDVAVVTLKRPLKLKKSSAVSATRLPYYESDAMPDRGTYLISSATEFQANVSGWWGNRADDSSGSSSSSNATLLDEVSVRLRGENFCQDMFASSHGVASDKLFCARGIREACIESDPGAPVTHDDTAFRTNRTKLWRLTHDDSTTDNTVLWGLATSARRCGDDNLGGTALFTRVSAHIGWIEGVIATGDSEPTVVASAASMKVDLKVFGLCVVLVVVAVC